EDPDQLAPAGAAAHFLGEHGIDAAGNSGVAAAGIAAADRLIGLVDENVATAQGLQQTKNPLQITFRTAPPLVAEVFELQNRNSGFAGQAFDHEGLAGPNRAAEQIALRHGGEVTLAPERNVLAEPGFDLFLALNVVECAR